jgi:hypothetical protein
VWEIDTPVDAVVTGGMTSRAEVTPPTPLPYGCKRITPARIGSDVLGWIAIDYLAAEHRVRVTPHFMLNRKQLPIRFGMHDVEEAILMVVAFFSDQVMPLQPGMWTREVADVYRNVMAIILRGLAWGFAEDQAL